MSTFFTNSHSTTVTSINAIKESNTMSNTNSSITLSDIVTRIKNYYSCDGFVEKSSTMVVSLAYAFLEAAEASAKSEEEADEYTFRFIEVKGNGSSERDPFTMDLKVSLTKTELDLLQDSTIPTIIENDDYWSVYSDLDLRYSSFDYVIPITWNYDVSYFRSSVDDVTVDDLERVYYHDVDLALEATADMDKILGKEVQFSNMKEFNAFMKSDETLVF